MKRSIWLSTAVAMLLPWLLPQSARSATQAEINASIEKGVAWLVTRQAGNGSWPGSGYTVGNTGLAVNTLIHHARHLGQDPFSPAYAHQARVLAGLNYIFDQTQRDATNQRVNWNSNYEWGPAVMAITSSGQKDRVVDRPGSPIHGMTFLQVVQEALRHIEHVQLTLGDNVGSWDYYPSWTGADLSAAGWVALGFGYASYNFDIVLSAVMISRLSQAIDKAQWLDNPTDPRYGGGVYRADYRAWVNLYKAGHLLYMMDVVGDSMANPRVQRVLSHIVAHWNKPNSGQSGHSSMVNGEYDMGWRGGPVSPQPSYIATVAMMKAFVGWGLDTIGVGIDWYGEMTDVIVARQNVAGWWDQGGYPSGYRELSTIWALLTMLRAVPASGSITDITSTSANFTAETDADGTGYWLVVERGAPAPSAEQTKAGTDGAGTPASPNGTGAMVADTPQVFALTGLQPGTRYDLYFVNELSPGVFSPVVRVQFATLDLGSMMNVTGLVDIRNTNWRLNYSTGALIATFRVEYLTASQLKPQLHTAFWIALPDTDNSFLESKDGMTGGVPYTDVTAQVEAVLWSKYGRGAMQAGDVVMFELGIFSRDRSVPPVEAMYAFWADPPIHAADANRDGILDDFEMLTVVDDWYAGRISDFDFLDAIALWRAGTQP